MLRDRLLTALVGAPLLLLALWHGGWAYFFVVGVVAGVALLESQGLVAGGRQPGRLMVSAATAAILFGAIGTGQARWIGALLAVVVYGFGLGQVIGYPGRQLAGTGGALMVGLYVGWCFGHFPALRLMPGGLGLTLLAFILTWTFDSMAYFAGTRWGRHRLAPRISPGKSWEGAAAGALATLGVALIPLAWWPADVSLRVAAAAVVVLLGQAGDLLESALKRLAGVKDSGAILPGHGGILDRFDSLMFVVPAVYYLAIGLGGAVS